MIRALLFDLDGTLADTESANFVSYQKAFAEVGRTLEREQYRAAFGLRFSDLVKRVAPGLTAAEQERVKASKAEHYRRQVSLVRPNGALLGLLRALRPSHKTALVSTAARENAESVLLQLDLTAADFDVRIFGEDVEKGKPHPECYLQAITALQVPANQCLVFEDSDVGVQAAEASGASVIQVRVP